VLFRSIGREQKTKGKNKNGQCWRVAVNKPDDDASGLIDNIDDIIGLCGKKGLATSGNYRNFYIKDGKKYAHTIDPKTGYPSEQSILSATIVAPDCMTADAYATAFMAMGIEAACQMAETIPEIEYLIIYPGDSPLHPYQKKYSPGFKTILLKK
jgi:thiamine biosynthesis lipoprotein